MSDTLNWRLKDELFEDGSRLDVPDEKQLVARLRSGDDASYERLVPGFQQPNLCDFLLDQKKFQRVPRDVTTDGARVTNAKSSSPLP